MPLDTLTTQQQAFIEQFLTRSFFSKKKDQKTVASYETYLAQEGMFKQLATSLPREDQRVTTLIANLRPTLDAKSRGDFDQATALIAPLVEQATNLQDEYRKRRQGLLESLDARPIPAWTPADRLDAMTAEHDKAENALRPEYPTQAQFDDAEQALQALGTLIDQAAIAVRGRKQTLLNDLARLGPHSYASGDAQKTLTAQHDLATKALAADLPTEADFTDAGKAIEAYRLKAEEEKQAVAEKRRVLQDRLGKLTDPTGADADDLKDLKAARDMATNALAAELPTPAQIRQAEAAIDALQALIRQVKRVAPLAGKYGARSDVAAQTKNALKGFHAVLGDIDVTDTVITDARQAAQEKADALAEKLQAWKDARNLPDGTQQERIRKQQAIERTAEEWRTVNAEKAKADAYLKAAQGQKGLLDAVAGGPLSAGSDQRFKESTAATLIKAFTENPTLAATALNAAKTAKFPDAIADGWPAVRDAVATGMKSATGQHFIDPKHTEYYGGALLGMAGKAGGDYLSRLPDYLASGAQFEPSPLEPLPGTWDEVTKQRTSKLAATLMQDDGTIDLDSPAAQKMIGASLYDLTALAYPTPDLTRHMLKSLKELKDPEAGRIMKGVRAPTTGGGKGLVQKSLGKGPSDSIDDKDTRNAIMTSMLTPLSQSTVGSCFATAPARMLRETRPMDALKSYAEIATKGTYKPPFASTEVPAVTNIAQNEDPIMRSFEYSLATATARENNSREKTKFTGSMAPGIDQIRPIVGGPDTVWNQKKAALRNAISSGFTFTYDPTIKTEHASDGSSEMGRYVLKAAAGDKAIMTKDDFAEAIAAVAIASLGYGTSSEEAKKIKALTKDDAFINAVCPGTYKPWELATGGFGDQATQSLFGSGLSLQTFTQASTGSPPPTEGQRAASVLTGMLNQFSGKSGDMTVMNTNGIHSFIALPNDPSLAPLKGANPTETAQKVQEKLVQKGQDLKNTDLPADRAAYLFDEQVNTVLAAEKGKGSAANADWIRLLEDGIRAHRPTTAMKPADLNTAITDTLRPYNDAVATKGAEDWKSEEENSGKTISDQELQKRITDYKAYYAKQTQNKAKTSLMRDMGAPEFVIADTNWGSGQSHTFFVIAPDPTTGEPALWAKDDPPGTLRPMEKKWLDTDWQTVE